MATESEQAAVLERAAARMRGCEHVWDEPEPGVRATFRGCVKCFKVEAVPVESPPGV